MSPEQARRALDASLARYGQTVLLERLSPPSMAVLASVSVQAHIIDYTPQDMFSGIGLQMGDSKMTMSTTEVTDADWPSVGASPIPRKGDRVIIAGRTRTVLFGWAAPYVDGELVRIELSIR